jgi:NADPH-dependent curcumin reductase CurA|tara:strand:- start:6044 stop:7042 length:999 start_codon:yes stop_codon:yes gene_type:complete
MNKSWILHKRPSGYPKSEDFRLVDSELPELSEGEILIESKFLSLDPYMRGRMNDTKSYAPSLKLGDVITGEAVGKVIKSRNRKIKEGYFVNAHIGWQEYGKTDGNSVRIIDPNLAPISTALGILGMPGLTAYFGLLNICKPLPGDTVVVSAASGAVGAVVGQIAKIMGCRVIGIAGSEQKIDYCSSELNFDFVINYKKENVINKILEYAPEGVDVYFDNVGGEISDAVISNIAIGGRIAICGQISLYNLEEASMGPRMGGTLLINQASMQGFLVFQFKSQYQDGLIRLSDWVRKGSLKYKEDIIDGIENVPKAFIGMMNGKNFGKLLIRLNN